MLSGVTGGLYSAVFSVLSSVFIVPLNVQLRWNRMNRMKMIYWEDGRRFAQEVSTFAMALFALIGMDIQDLSVELEKFS